MLTEYGFELDLLNWGSILGELGEKCIFEGGFSLNKAEFIDVVEDFPCKRSCVEAALPVSRNNGFCDNVSFLVP